jgi:hypothetical protein
MVAQACYASYLEGRDLEGSWFEASSGEREKVHETLTSTGTVVCACHSKLHGKAQIGVSWSRAGLGKKRDPISKITNTKHKNRKW